MSNIAYALKRFVIIPLFIDLLYNYFVLKTSEEEVQLSANICNLWSELFKESRRVDRSLGKVKKTFAEVVLSIYQ